MLPENVRAGAEQANQRVIDSLDRLTALVAQDSNEFDDQFNRAMAKVIDADKAVLKAKGKL